MKSITQFWSWFCANEHRLYSDCGASAIWDEIDQSLSPVSDELSWEIGPLDEPRDGKKMYFAISPEFNNALLPIVNELIGLAYVSDLWEFRRGRQRRPWDSVLEIASDNSEKHYFKKVNIATWRHIVFKVPDTDLVDIVFECGINFPLTGDDLDELGAMIAAGLIGELVVMERVNCIEVIDCFEARFENKAKPASWLPYAFDMKPL
mgnify:CR=1 FL=1